MRGVPTGALLVDHPALPDVRVTDHGLLPLPPPAEKAAHRSRHDRIAVAVQLLAATSLLAEVDLWPGLAAIRRAGVERLADGRRAVLAGLPRQLSVLHQRLGGGATAGRRCRDAVLAAVREVTGLPDGLFAETVEHDWLTLTPWIVRLLERLKKPLDPVTARSLWMVRWTPPRLPDPGEVAYWSVPDVAAARRIAAAAWQLLRRDGIPAWLREPAGDDAGTAPQVPVGAAACLVVVGDLEPADVRLVDRWVGRTDGARAVVAGRFPGGWAPPRPQVVDGARLDRHLFITGVPREQARLEVERRCGRFDPFSAADARSLTEAAAVLFTGPESVARHDAPDDPVRRTLGLLPGGVPEPLGAALTKLAPEAFRRKAVRAGGVEREGRWRLPGPVVLRADPLHAGVAELFAEGSPERLRHELLGGDGEQEFTDWARERVDDLDGGAVLRILGPVEPASVAPAVAVLLVEAALGSVDLAEARRWLAVLPAPDATPWRRWLDALDPPPDVSLRLAGREEAENAPRPAVEVALRILERAVLRGAAGGDQAREALTRGLPRLRGAVQRRVELHATLLGGSGARTDRSWRRRVVAGHPVLMRELLHRTALMAAADGRSDLARRLLTRVAERETSPGRAGLIQLDLGGLLENTGGAVRAERHHLQALRLLRAAGFRHRTGIALFNMAVSNLDRLEVDRARARFAESDHGGPDPALDAERARLALAVGDEAAFRDAVEGLPTASDSARLGMAEGVAFLRGAAGLLRHDLAEAEAFLARGGQEGEAWQDLARALRGAPADQQVDGDSDLWGVALAARLTRAAVREGAPDAGEDLPPSGRLEARHALAVALCERLLGAQQWLGDELRRASVAVLDTAGLTGWANLLRGRSPADDGFHAALGRLLEERSPAALSQDEVAALLTGVGLSGLEVRAAAGGPLLCRLGEGEPAAPHELGSLAFTPLGGTPSPAGAWRLLSGVLESAVTPAVESPEPDAVETGLYGSSEPIRVLRTELRRLAHSRLPVTLIGETGVGKEVAARALHRLSGRRGRFVAVNMAAVPAALVEAELFGSERGAFTGADRKRAGLAVTADGGTLFLDEIGDLDLTLQAKLLRFLESYEVRPVGSDRLREVDVRIVTATHNDLESLVGSGGFRADLYYRIASATVTIAPLRERREDIPLLRRLFEGEIARRDGGAPPRWSRDAEAALAAYQWPGNVRELRHVVEVALARADGGVVGPEHLPFRTVAAEPACEGSYEEALNGFRRRLFTKVLEQNGGNRSAAARELGISRQTLLYHIRALDLRNV